MAAGGEVLRLLFAMLPSVITFFFCLIDYLVLFTERCFCKLTVWIKSAADFGSVYWKFDNLGRGKC